MMILFSAQNWSLKGDVVGDGVGVITLSRAITTNPRFLVIGALEPVAVQLVGECSLLKAVPGKPQ